MQDKYKDALRAAQEELQALEKRREVLLRFIEDARDLARVDRYELDPLPGYEPEGMTQEIRLILGLTTTPLTPTEIRDALVARGFKNESSPKNLLIAVHTVLSRIKDELETVERDGKTAYRGKRIPIHTTLIPRAKIVPGSFAEKFFAEDDAKKRKKD
jgi:hypothetical protein